jgi:hypothetical protein
MTPRKQPSTNAVFFGGGKVLINSYYAFAERLGVNIVYEGEARDLEIRDGHFASVPGDMRSAEQPVDNTSVSWGGNERGRDIDRNRHSGYR